MKSGLFSRHGIDEPTPEGLVKVTEGFAAVLFPPAKGSQKSQVVDDEPYEKAETYFDEEAATQQKHDEDQAIFYNPAQVVNRDLSICAIEAFSRLRPLEPARKGGTQEGVTVLEALSATGLRAIRYWKEITGLKFIIANDLDSDAVECIARNCAYNEVPLVAPTLRENISEEDAKRGGGVIPNCDDAIVLMQRLGLDVNHMGGSRVALHTFAEEGQAQTKPLLQQELMDVVDLDPYGTASPFLDSAFGCIKEGGLMLVTSTDSPILCGNYPETCHAKYNSIMMKPDACHEVAVRILLASIERVANKHKKYIVPLISLHIDFYVRVFFRVYTQPAEVKLSTAKLAHVAHCTRCPSFWMSPIGKVKTTRKEMNKKKRQREEGGAAPPPAPPCEPSIKVSSYPAVPDRSQPFKVGCPTLENWLPDNHNLCPVCGGHIALGGPIYAAPTQNIDFLEKLLAVIEERAAEGKVTAVDRITGLVKAAMDELPEAPLFYSLPEIASFAKVRCPPTPIFVGALTRLGYRFSQVHCHRSGIKTTCPPNVLIEAMLAYRQLDEEEERKKGIEGTALAKCTEGSTALLVKPLEGLDFSYDRQYDFRSSVTGVAKFVPNAPGWGPKRRHQGIERSVTNE